MIRPASPSIIPAGPQPHHEPVSPLTAIGSEIHGLVVLGGHIQFQGRDFTGRRVFRVHCRRDERLFKPDRFGIEIWNGTDTSVPPAYRVMFKEMSTGRIAILD